MRIDARDHLLRIQGREQTRVREAADGLANLAFVKGEVVGGGSDCTGRSSDPRAS